MYGFRSRLKGTSIIGGQKHFGKTRHLPRFRFAESRIWHFYGI
jgi:hypothetical protein